LAFSAEAAVPQRQVIDLVRHETVMRVLTIHKLIEKEITTRENLCVLIDDSHRADILSQISTKFEELLSFFGDAFDGLTTGNKDFVLVFSTKDEATHGSLSLLWVHFEDY